MFFDNCRISRGERGEVVADTCVGDDEVEVVDSLRINLGDGDIIVSAIRCAETEESELVSNTFLDS